MEINFSTKNLIVTNYPGHAGGKFINKALALHPKVLFQQEKMARSKMAGQQDIESSSALIQRILNAKKLRNEHIEYDCYLISDFNYLDLNKDIMADEKKCSNFWKELTNQDEFYFFMIDHGDGTAFKRYLNRKTLRLVNFEWLVDDRAPERIRELPSWTEKARHLSTIYRGDVYEVSKMADLSNLFLFDMNSLKDSALFKEEITKVLDFIGLPIPEDDKIYFSCLEEIRNVFLETYKIGFPWRD